ncbi:right-handed parallel beta-helix repeat-containing protein [Pontibacter sp. HJ8]
MKRFTTAITVLIFLCSFGASAETYYISLNGDDTNSGVEVQNAWASIAKVNSTTFAPGDSILFEGGATFSGSIFFGPTVKGTPDQPIVLSSYGEARAIISSGTQAGIYVENTAGFKVQHLIFRGSGRETNTASGVDFYMELPNTRLAYIAIDNVEVYGYREAGISIGSWSGTSGYDDVTITNCLSHDNGDSGIKTYADDYKIGHKNVYIAHSKAFNNAGLPDRTWSHSGNGIVMGGVDGGIIEYCEAYNNGWLNAWTSGGPVGIWGYLCNNLIIQYNESHHNRTGTTKDGGGFDIDGGSTNSIMQYNYSHDNEGAGYLLAQFDYAPVMKNIVVRYNISENDGRKNGYAAIHLWSTTAKKAQAIQNAQIYNNTVYLSPAASGVPKAVWVQAGGATQATFRNNLFVTTGGVSLMNIEATTNIRFEGNNYWTTGATPAFKWGATTHTSLAAWRNATSQERLNGIALGHFLDPGLKNPGQGVTIAAPQALYTLQGYELQKSSAMIGKGLDLTKDFGLNTGTQDFWGNSIKQRADLCIGAHQVTDNSKACLQGGALPLAFGLSEEGLYSGQGVSEGKLFDPLVAGLGNHALLYTYTDVAGLSKVTHHTVQVVDALATSWTGANNTTDWFDSENWTTCVPTAKVDATIPASETELNTMPVIREGEHALAHDLAAAGVLSIEQGGTLELKNKLLSANLKASPLSNIIFASDATQAIPAGTYGNLVLQGSGTKKLTGTVTVANLLNLNLKKLLLGDHKLTLAGTGSILNYSPTAYIVTDGAGELMFEAMGSGVNRVFPVGTLGSYAPVKLQNKGTTDSFGVRVEEGFQLYTSDGSTVEEGAVNKTWHITEETEGGSDVAMNLQWNVSDELPNFVRDSGYITHFDNGEWDLVESSIGTVQQGATPNTHSINITGVKSFSPFAVASTQETPVPLPVSLYTFTAVQRDFDVLLEWGTASELDNYGFEVEVSEDGRQFRTIGLVKSRVVNSQIIQRYSFRESGIREAGTRYYRLRQLDLDGTATYSAVKAVVFNKVGIVSSAYPNPFSDIVMLELEAYQEQELLLTITDTQGKKIFQKSIFLPKGLMKLPLDLSEVPPSSMCIVTAYLNNTTHYYKLYRK